MKTPEQVISKYQRRLENVSKHVIGLIDKNANLKHELKTLEDTLLWIYRKEPDEWPKVREVIERRMSSRLHREAEDAA